MSRGIGVHAYLSAQDREKIVYRYGGYNMNIAEYRNGGHLYDGNITVSRNCFAEAEEENTASGDRKADFFRMIGDGRIVIENCSCCWQRVPDHGIDVMALHLLYKLFRIYQEEGKAPESVDYHV